MGSGASNRKHPDKPVKKAEPVKTSDSHTTWVPDNGNPIDKKPGKKKSIPEKNKWQNLNW